MQVDVACVEVTATEITTVIERYACCAAAELIYGYLWQPSRNQRLSHSKVGIVPARGSLGCSIFATAVQTILQ